MSQSNSVEEKETISKAISVIYDVIDVDHEGGISTEEFSTYFKSLGLEDEDFVAKLFAEIDVDGGGSLDRDGKRDFN